MLLRWNSESVETFLLDVIEERRMGKGYASYDSFFSYSLALYRPSQVTHLVI